MNNNKYIGIAMMAATMLAATSCSDFSDYNEVKPEQLASGSQTLWENIQQNPKLSNFAALVKQAGFDSELNANSYYTVWAPLDGTYDASAFSQLNQSSLQKQFVYNHVASYSHQASGTMNEQVQMLNDKTYNFVGSPYTFDEVGLSEANVPSSNGILHILNGLATYYPNMYEYLMDTSLSGTKGVDSLRQYFKHYETTYLDESASVEGPVVDGLRTYIDSVMITENALTNMLRTAFEVEDSNYTFLLPTNEAWVKTYDRVKSYYNYIPTTQAQAFEQSSTGTSVSSTNATVTVEGGPAYWQDSITKRLLTRNLVFSNKDAYNQWVEGAPTVYGSDTIRSTTRNKFSNPQAILGQTKEKVKMSNGYVRLVDSLAFYPWETYAPEIVVSAGLADNRARIATGNSQVYRVLSSDPKQEPFSYVWIEPTGNYAKPELTLYLDNVLSTTYNIYCVFIPPYIDSSIDRDEGLPNRVNFELNYCDENGQLQSQMFLDENEDHIQAFRDLNATFGSKVAETPANMTTYKAFSNDPTKIDTLFIGQFTFPVSYAGLSTTDRICPNIKITSPFSVFNRDIMAAYTRDLRIAAIILRPVELDEYEESNKQ